MTLVNFNEALQTAFQKVSNVLKRRLPYLVSEYYEILASVIFFIKLSFLLKIKVYDSNKVLIIKDLHSQGRFQYFKTFIFI